MFCKQIKLVIEKNLALSWILSLEKEHMELLENAKFLSSAGVFQQLKRIKAETLSTCCVALVNFPTVIFKLFNKHAICQMDAKVSIAFLLWY